ncbi:MAG: methyltransferase [Pseudomonadota bacterium]|nr:methyltransferase [Pseudomonadota bacterium]
MSLITSRQNPLIKHVAKLLESPRERRKHQQFVVEGIHLAQLAMESGWPVTQLILAESVPRHPEVAAMLAVYGAVQPILLSDGLFQQLFEIQPNVGIVVLMSQPLQSAMTRGGDFSVLLDDIQDPGNLGTIMRTAVAAGVSNIYLSQGCADVWSPKVLRAAMGAHFQVQLSCDVDLLSVLEALNGKMLVTDLAAKQSLYDVDLRGPVGMIFGNEGAGVSERLKAVAGDKVLIPMPGKVESLNVAAAAAICLFECVRQRCL